jgi:hypothetical protein
LIVWDDLLFGEQLFRDLKPCLCHSVQFGDILPPRTLSHCDTLVGKLLALQGKRTLSVMPLPFWDIQSGDEICRRPLT